MPSHVNLRKETGYDYEAIKKVSGMAFSEIASRSVELLINSLPEEQRNMIRALYRGAGESNPNPGGTNE